MKLENYTVPRNENKEKDGCKGIIIVMRRYQFKTREKTEKFEHNQVSDKKKILNTRSKTKRC